MMQSFFLAIAVIFATNAILIAWLAWAYYSPRFSERRISQGRVLKVTTGQRVKLAMFIGALSLVAVLAPLYFFFEQLIGGGEMVWWQLALQSVGILMIYDFLYYWLHRIMHNKTLMRTVHGVHHRARNPSALESFYLHPVELLGGLGLLFVSALIIGPVHPIAFLVLFFFYSNMNILIHSGIHFKSKWMWPINHMTLKHHIHHQDNMKLNYSALTPFPDMLFRTFSGAMPRS